MCDALGNDYGDELVWGYIMLEDPKSPITQLKYIADDDTRRLLINWTGDFLTELFDILTECKQMTC